MVSTARIQKMNAGQLRDAFTRANRRVQRFAERSAEYSERGVAAMATVTGGAMVGAAEGMLDDPNVPGTGMPITAAAGGALMLAGIAGLGGKQAEAVTAMGAGMLAVHASNWAKTAAGKTFA